MTVSASARSKGSPGGQARLHWALRLAAAFCFIGHGAWGVITKAGWLPFFDRFGIPEDVAWKLMPVIGSFDIAMGITVLLRPRRAVLLWMAVWATWTAALRPLAGMGMWEFWERAGNFGPPIALLMLAGPVQGLRGWLAGYDEPPATERTLARVRMLLRACLASLLIGHGAFAVLQRKDLLAGHLAAIGLDAYALPVLGWVELALAAAVLVSSSPLLLGFVLVWKIATEALYPMAGQLLDVFETIERAGDYGIPVALIVLARRARAGTLEGLS